MAGIKLSYSEETCYEKVRSKKQKCGQEDCRNFVHNEQSYNCAVLAAEEGPMTLQEIGDVFGVSRMRICQIEKTILAKLRKTNSGFDEFTE